MLLYYCTSTTAEWYWTRKKRPRIMTIRMNRQLPTTAGEVRRPAFPIDQQSGSLFLGWGPKI